MAASMAQRHNWAMDALMPKDVTGHNFENVQGHNSTLFCQGLNCVTS